MQDVYATQIELLQSATDQSFYELNESLCYGFRNDPLHRFLTLMRKMKAQSFVQEALVPNHELLDEQEMASIVCGRDVDLTAIRLTFFYSMPESKHWQDIPNEYILGYAVIIKLHFSDHPIRTYVLESVVRSSVIFSYGNEPFLVEPVTNYYLHNQRTFFTTVGSSKEDSRNFAINGSFFTQQNSLTSACAHATLRMCINSSPTLDYKNKITNRFINESLQIDLNKYSIQNPLKYLTRDQIEDVICNLGYNVLYGDFVKNWEIEYDQYLYPTLESCCPTILGLDIPSQNIGHAVAVLGHTLNSDRWSPQARRGYGNYPITKYHSATSWCDHYIISDDNFGMHLTLPSDMIRNVFDPNKNPNLHAIMAMSIVPRDIILPGYYAEQAAAVLIENLLEQFKPLEEINAWFKRLYQENNIHRSLVYRTLLLNKDQYLAHLNKHNEQITEQQMKRLSNLPGFIWVTEISLPNIYTGNKAKLGDMVLRTDITKEDIDSDAFEGFVMAWFPGIVQFWQSDMATELWGIDSHIPLIRHSDETLLLEW